MLHPADVLRPLRTWHCQVGAMRGVGNAYPRHRLPSRVCWFTFEPEATHRVERANPSSLAARVGREPPLDLLRPLQAEDLRESLGDLQLPRAPLPSAAPPAPASCLRRPPVRPCSPPFRRTSFAPHGRTGWVTPSDFVVSTWPHVVRSASPTGPRDPANALFQPLGASAVG